MKVSEQQSLTREQKEAVRLLSIGTIRNKYMSLWELDSLTIFFKLHICSNNVDTKCMTTKPSIIKKLIVSDIF